MTEETRIGSPCKSTVKSFTGERNKCGTFLPRGKPECPNKKDHMWKFKSGFCAVGWCEGTSAQDSKGKYVKTCHLWSKCNCKCHVDIDKMFIATESDRILMENSKYHRPKSPYVMPKPEDNFDGLSGLKPDHVALDEGTDGQIVIRTLMDSDPRRTVFHETNSGKRARGQLEYQVLSTCRAFVKGQVEVEVLTPQVIALDIDEIEPPSVGAIGAVFDRWVKIGFANCEKKPVRFTSFTAEGLEIGLDATKDKFKRNEKIKQGNQSRSLRPGG